MMPNPTKFLYIAMMVLLGFLNWNCSRDRSIEGMATENLLDQGPFLGHIGSDGARIWARFMEPGKYMLHLAKPSGDTLTYSHLALPENDLTITWDLFPLDPGQQYSIVLSNRERQQFSHPEVSFSTSPDPEVQRSLKLVFASCADDDDGVDYPVFDSMANHSPEALILLGDTPYIDSVDLNYQYSRYRNFYEVPQLAQLMDHIPLYSTWDDHDFGLDGSDGTMPNKQVSRQAFIAYRANPGYGENEQGIYTRFRKGPVEVFLLDTRWFSGTEPSPVDTTKSTLLGKQQYYWLLRGLLNSTAEFKILSSGMIWNDAVRPNKPDYWGNYGYERDSLFAFIGRNNISGVVLVGGDIHRSRLVMHQSEELAGYQIPELVSSPLHEGIIENANADHPGLLFDMGEANAYLVVEASNEGKPYLEGSFYTADGKLHYRQRFGLEELRKD